MMYYTRTFLDSVGQSKNKCQALVLVLVTDFINSSTKTLTIRTRCDGIIQMHQGYFHN